MQISHPTLGSPNAMVTSNAELVVTGSINVTKQIIGSNAVLGAGNVGPMAIDNSTHGVISLTQGHNMINDGSHYFVKSFATQDSGACSCFEVTTPSSITWAHMVFEIQGMLVTEVNVWEGATLSGGTATTPINNNRNSTNSSVMTIRNGTVVSGASPTSGTKIWSSRFGLSTGQGANSLFQGGKTGAENEMILKSGTTYLYEILSLTDSNLIDYRGSWYEHIDKS